MRQQRSPLRNTLNQVLGMPLLKKDYGRKAQSGYGVMPRRSLSRRSRALALPENKQKKEESVEADFDFFRRICILKSRKKAYAY